MLGSPDDDATNDWMTSDGTVLPLPTRDLRGQEGYDYCTTNWCIRDPTKSLFVYDGTKNFSFYSGCNEDFPGNVDLNLASQELRLLRGMDVACTIDGIELAIDGAQSLLESESAVAAASSSARFRAVPATIKINVPINVVLTVNLTDAAANASIGNIDEFRIYRVDSETREVGETAVVVLQDIGLGVGTDTKTGDRIYSNVLAVLSNSSGETFSFKAVPIIQRTAYPSSPFAFTALNAVRSYSLESGIGVNNTDPNGVITVDSIEGLVLFIRYSWPVDFSDLDTAAVFLGSTVGYGCGAYTRTYMTYSGDNTGYGGTETVRVLLGKSFVDGQWSSHVVVHLKAGWYGTLPKGVASIAAYTEKMLSNGTVVSGNNAVTFVITPGFQRGCARTLVAVANVTVGNDGKSPLK